MNKNEFMEYLKYLRQLFPTSTIIPTNDKEVIATWYEGFKNTHLHIAKLMAQMYLQEEQKNFNYARLLSFKSKAMAGRTYKDNNIAKVKCDICDSLGVVQIDTIKSNKVYQTFYRCICNNGNQYSRYPLLDKSMLLNQDKVTNGMYRFNDNDKEKD